MRGQKLYPWLLAAVLLAVAAVVLRTSQPARQVVGVRDHIQSSFASVPSPTPLPEGQAEEAACQRPYPDTSIWNVPLDWSKARIHPMSDQMMNAFFKSDDWIGSDTSKYTPNIYWVTNSTPLVPVRLLENRFRDAIDDQELKYGEPGGIVWMPLPADAQPAVGTDGQLVVINVDTGEEWGLNEGYVDDAGNWYAGGAYRYHIENYGIPPEGFGQRGAGIGQLAGIVRHCEVERGYIGHAVTLAYDHPCKPAVCEANGWPAFIPPFRKTDGRGIATHDIPEGARIAVRPEIPREEIEEACDGVKGCVVWVLNMQEYGGFVVDNSGHPKTYAEGDATANWNPSVWSENMLRDIPAHWFIVIDWNHPFMKES